MHTTAQTRLDAGDLDTVNVHLSTTPTNGLLSVGRFAEFTVAFGNPDDADTLASHLMVLAAQMRQAREDAKRAHAAAMVATA